MAIQSLEHSIFGQAGFPDPWPRDLDSTGPEGRGHLRVTLLGLPCSRCRIYFSADLNACPICGGKDRVSPTTTWLRHAIEV